MPRPFFCLSMGQMMQESNDYTPALQGASNNPVPTFSVQSGVYVKMGGLCYFCVNLTSTSMTKVTLTDPVLITLPYLSASLPFTTHDVLVNLSISNGTFVKNANYGRIIKGTQVIEARYNSNGADQAYTYGLGDLGVLTNTITIRASGVYIVQTDAG